MAAATPSDPAALGRFLDQVVAELVAGDRQAPPAALAAAGRATRGTGWNGYRSGRSRLASMAATYLRWLAPPLDWRFDGVVPAGGRHGIRWRSPEDRQVVDLLDAGGDGFEKCAAAVWSAAGGVDAVRVIRLTAPGTSVVLLGPGRIVRLAGSPYSFEERR